MSELLPLELLFELFLLLPVLTLLRLRVVSKQWRALIDSPTFQRSHFNHHSKKKPHDSVMIWFNGRSAADYVDLYSFWNCSTIPRQKLRYPIITTDPELSLTLPPVNGVLCVATERQGAFLWNPFIRRHLNIPPPPPPPRNQHPYRNRYGESEETLWSFGYDCVLDDYKLVFISRLKVKRNGYRFAVWVYSVKLGFWRSISDLPHWVDSISPYHGAFVSGALHWCGCGEEPGASEFIFALDLGNFEYRLVPEPKPNKRHRRFKIGVLDGCLSCHSFCYMSSEFDLWVMKDYGVSESWTKLISHCWTNLISTGPRPPLRLTPLAYAENGKKLLFVDYPASSLVVGYDFETRSFKIVFHDFGVHLIDAHVYTPSLLFPC